LTGSQPVSLDNGRICYRVPCVGGRQCSLVGAATFAGCRRGRRRVATRTGRL